MKNIAGKKTLITGAANGIGREIAKEMAALGAELAVLDRDEKGLCSLVDEIRQSGGKCIPLVCDLSSEEQIVRTAKTLLSRWGTLQILINNAGVGAYGPIHEMTDETRRKVLAINLHAPIILFQQFVHQLLNEDEAHIVNIASVLGLAPCAKSSIYATSKYGIVGFTESLRADYVRWGLGVSLICPGFVKTRMIADLPSQSTDGKPLNLPPDWLCTTPNKVARKVVSAIRRKKRLVVVTPLAKFIYNAKRLFPGLFDLIQNFKSSGIRKRLFGWLRRRKSSPVEKTMNEAPNSHHSVDKPSAENQVAEWESQEIPTENLNEEFVSSRELPVESMVSNPPSALEPAADLCCRN